MIDKSKPLSEEAREKLKQEILDNPNVSEEDKQTIRDGSIIPYYKWELKLSMREQLKKGIVMSLMPPYFGDPWDLLINPTFPKGDA